MRILDYKLYYFLGIGGIGMSALARYFNHYGKPIYGYDKTSTELTQALEQEGIVCHYEEKAGFVKELFSEYKPEEILVIYTPAVPKDHEELLYIQQQNIALKKRSEVLGEITKQFKTIAIAGTHGKTTTTTLVTHLLKTAGINCYAFLGGISKNYNTNLLLGDPEQEAYVVVEADEYDRSFLTLYPHIAVITSVDPDHLDIYGDKQAMHDSYTQFAGQVKAEGHLIVKKAVNNDLSIKNKHHIYSLNLNTEYCADAIHIDNGDFCYTILNPQSPITEVRLGLPGLHNVENSIAAAAVGQQLGIQGDVIKQAFRSFQGVKRRFDYRIKTTDLVYIDDYAHHPEELKAAIGAARQLYPGKKITGIFQPHLYSRTRDFLEGFAESLDLLDECILLDIYPARELPIPGITSELLLSKMNCPEKVVLKKDDVTDYLNNKPLEVVMTLGAGSVDTLIEPIEQLLKLRTR